MQTSLNKPTNTDKHIAEKITLVTDLRNSIWLIYWKDKKWAKYLRWKVYFYI